MSKEKGHPKMTLLSAYTAQGVLCSFVGLRVFVQSFCAVIVQKNPVPLKPAWLVEPSGIEPLTSTLPVYPVQKPKHLILNHKDLLAPIPDFGGFLVLWYKGQSDEVD